MNIIAEYLLLFHCTQVNNYALFIVLNNYRTINFTEQGLS